MSDGGCPGSCNDQPRATLDAYRTVLVAYDAAVLARMENPLLPEPQRPEQPEVRLWPGDPILCGKCSGRCRRELTELSDLAAIAEAEFTGQRRGPEGQRVSGSRHSPSPSPVADDLDELGSILRDWEAVARGTDTLPRRGYLAGEIATLCSRLATACFPALIENRDVAMDFASEVHQWHRKFRDMTRTGTGRHQKNRPCPRCDRYSLVWTEGDSHIECQTPSCGRLLSLDEYSQYDSLFDHFEDAAASA